jgi:hypothetical protein
MVFVCVCERERVRKKQSHHQSIMFSSEMCMRPTGSARDLVGRQLVPDVGHLDVFALVVVAAHLEHESAHVALDGLLGDAAHELRDREVQSLLLLGWRHEEGEEHAHTLRQHGNLQVVCVFEIFEQLLQRHVLVDFKSVPQGPLATLEILPSGRQRLGEREQGQSEVHEAVLEASKLFGVHRWSSLRTPAFFAWVSVGPPEIQVFNM